MLNSDKESIEALAADDCCEFQDYRQWKAAAKDSPECWEFERWREWKAYRAWKEQQPR